MLNIKGISTGTREVSRWAGYRIRRSCRRRLICPKTCLLNVRTHITIHKKYQVDHEKTSTLRKKSPQVQEN